MLSSSTTFYVLRFLASGGTLWAGLSVTGGDHGQLHPGACFVSSPPRPLAGISETDGSLWAALLKAIQASVCASRHSITSLHVCNGRY